MAQSVTAPTAVNKQAYKLACHYLARREYSRYEMMQKLLQKGYGLGEVEAVLSYLQTQDLLSEIRFVEAYVASRIQRGIGPVRIRAELSKRGVQDELIKEQLNAYRDEWPALAHAVIKKRFKEAASSYREYQRQIQFLVYRGFEPAHLSDVLEQAAECHVMC